MKAGQELIHRKKPDFNNRPVFQPTQSPSGIPLTEPDIPDSLHKEIPHFSAGGCNPIPVFQPFFLQTQPNPGFNTLPKRNILGIISPDMVLFHGIGPNIGHLIIYNL